MTTLSTEICGLAPRVGVAEAFRELRGFLFWIVTGRFAR